MKAKDVMTSPVISVEPDASIWQAVRIMLQRRISGLPVIDKHGYLVGMVTEGDFLRRAETGTQRHRSRWLEFLLGPGRLADEYTRSHGRKIQDIMTSDPVTVTEDTSLDEVVRTMEKRGIKRLPIVRGNDVVGMITRANLVHALAGVARELMPTTTSDEAIRERLLSELAKEAWAPVGLIDVTVRNGVVDLWGTITEARQRPALVAAAENVPGVKAVHDHLGWVDVMSGMTYLREEEPVVAKAS
ncbi:MAG TPA: CBS domain-containing protein [Xanthobacteraceae bacterium]|nr:CBS domain-containing protein [Xanthobacteraceae bacterium]